MNNPKFLNAKQLRERLGISMSKFINAKKAGNLPPGTKIGRTIMYSVQVVEEFERTGVLPKDERKQLLEEAGENHAKTLDALSKRDVVSWYHSDGRKRTIAEMRKIFEQAGCKPPTEDKT